MKLKFKNITGVTYTHLKNVASSDDLRPAMQGVHINLELGRLECTDAHICCLYPIEILESEGEVKNKIVPIRFFNVLKYMIDIPKKFIELLEYVIEDDFAEVYFGGDLVYRCKYVDATFPKIESILPSVEDVIVGVPKIGLNMDILNKFSKSFPRTYPNNFVFSFYADNKGIIGESMANDFPKMKGVIMPVMLQK